MVFQSIDVKKARVDLTENIIFEFSFRDAWLMPYHSFIVTENGKIYLYNREDGLQYAKLDEPFFERIQAILLNSIFVFDEDFKIEPIKHRLILDGYTQLFTFSVADEKREFIGSNLDCYEESLVGYPDETVETVYPCVLKLFNILSEFSKLLEKEVDQKYFCYDK